MRFIRFYIAVAMLLVASTVSFSQSSPTGAERTVRPADDRPELKLQSEERYKLVPGDVIDISYRYTPEFNQSVTIQPDGYVGLQIVGDIKLGGLSLEEARAKIAQKAIVRLKDPEITLLLREFQKPYFVVSGEVGAAGRFEMRETVTALQAVMMAGGFKDSAKTTQVVVFRKLNDEMAEVRSINLGSIKKTSDLENDFALRSGDIVYVPRNTFSKIERFMRLTSIVGIFGTILR